MKKSKKRVINLSLVIVLILTCTVSKSKDVNFINSQVKVLDEDQNISFSSVTLNSPPDVTYLAGDPRPYEIVWVATGDNSSVSGTYTVTRNGTPYDSGIWQSGIDIPVDVSNISIVVYYIFIITVNITTALVKEHYRFSDAIDRVDLNIVKCLGWDGVVEGDDDLEMTVGTTGNIIRWLVVKKAFGIGKILNDQNDHVEVILVGHIVDLDPVNENWGYIEYEVDHLPIGGYTFTCMINYTQCGGAQINPTAAADSVHVTVNEITETSETFGWTLGFTTLIFMCLGLFSLRRKNK